MKRLYNICPLKFFYICVVGLLSFILFSKLSVINKYFIKLEIKKPFKF